MDGFLARIAEELQSKDADDFGRGSGTVPRERETLNDTTGMLNERSIYDCKTAYMLWGSNYCSPQKFKSVSAQIHPAYLNYSLSYLLLIS